MQPPRWPQALDAARRSRAAIQIDRSDPRLFWAWTEPGPARQTSHGHLVERLRGLSTAVNQTTDGICITDRDGRIEDVNPAFEAMTGFRRDEMIGQTTRLFQSGAHGPDFYRRLWDTVLAGKVFRHVFSDRTASGDLVYLDETITPITNPDGEVTHFVLAARDVTNLVHTEEALRRLNEGLEQQARRIAQTLHDEAGQYLTAAHIALDEAGRHLGADAPERLRAVRRHLDRIEEELRRLSHELHPRILDDLGLVSAIEYLADGVSTRGGIAVTVDAPLDEDLPSAVGTAVYRFVQEALTNVSRHARAARATVRIARQPGGLTCSVEDDGVGFDTAGVLGRNGAHSLGLRGIGDRLRAIKGTITITSAPGRGTTLTAAIPLET